MSATILETMLRMIVRVSIVTICLFSISCASYSEKKDKNDIDEPGALDLIICEDPRPQICTREYDPVCATREDGSVKTYSTGCTSCSDARVTGYKPGKC
jgi:hypothetical protein